LKAKLQWFGLWALQILLAFVFVNVGRIKLLTRRGGWEAAFREWGYPDHFFLLIGALEGLGGLLLLLPRTAFYGAVLLCTVMGGAVIHHLLRGEIRAFIPGVLLLLSGIVLYARRPDYLRRRASPATKAAG